MGKRIAVSAAALALAIAAGPPVAGAAGGKQRGKQPSARAKAFASCTGLGRYARKHAQRIVEPGGLPGRGVPAPLPVAEGDAPRQGEPGIEPAVPDELPAPGTDFSRTNVQEESVDEPDIVKTDGSRIFVASGGKLHSVDVTGGKPRLLDSLALEGSGHELLLAGDRVLVLSTGSAGPVPLPGPVGVPARAASSPIVVPNATLLAEVDVGDPRKMRLVRTLDAEGSYVSARLRESTARVVISSPPEAIEVPPPPEPGPETGAAAEARQRKAIRRAPLATWRPTYTVTRGRSKFRAPLVGCRSVRAPVSFSGLGTLSVLTIDLTRGLNPVDSDGLFTDAQTVYASTQSLYLATERWVEPTATPDRLSPTRSTTIHKLDIADGDRTAYLASGRVRGFVLSQWSFSERGGFLRVATTDEPSWFSPVEDRRSESFVTVLEQRGGALAEVGRVGGLGRGERIYAVRFIDDAGFVVTFRQADPLYTLDLSDPSEPKVLGELKILGYSAYLHPVGDDLLLGIGQDATEEGRVKGTQLSLFDVSDLRKPVRLHQRKLGSSSSSEVEYDHHAFLYWPATELAVIPVLGYASDRAYEPGFIGAMGFHLDRAKGIDEAGSVTHGGEGSAQIRRALVARDRLFTVSDLGVRASSLRTLEPVAFAPFE